MSRRRNHKSTIPAPIPPSTDLRIVFPYDKCHNRFNRRFYTPDMTDEKIEYKQLSAILKSFESIIHSSQVIVNTVTYVFLILSLIGFSFILYYDITEINNGYSLMVTLTIGYFAIFGFGSCIVYSFVGYKQKAARDKIQQVIMINDAMFGSQGLRWNLPPLFPKWIELWKDYKGSVITCNEGVLNKQESCIEVKEEPKLAQTRESSSYEHIQDDKELWQPLIMQRQA